MAAFLGPWPWTTAAHRLLIYCLKGSTIQQIVCVRYTSVQRLRASSPYSVSHSIHACTDTHRVGGGVTTCRAAWTASKAPRVASPPARRIVFSCGDMFVAQLLASLTQHLSSQFAVPCSKRKEESRGICQCCRCTAVTLDLKPAVGILCIIQQQCDQFYARQRHICTVSEKTDQLSCHACQEYAAFSSGRVCQLAISWRSNTHLRICSQVSASPIPIYKAIIVEKLKSLLS